MKHRATTKRSVFNILGGILLIVLAVLLYYSVGIIRYMSRTNVEENITTNDISRFLTNTVPEAQFKKNCTSEKLFCMDDSDCANFCLTKNISQTFACQLGTCILQNQTTSTNNCNPTRGIFSVFVGDSELGRINQICKSVDPGVALSDGNNKMCKGSDEFGLGELGINYLDHIPSLRDCYELCPESFVPVHTNSIVRTYAECNSDVYELLNISYSKTHTDFRIMANL